MTSLTRGPLPSRVYWRRRLFVLCLGAALVLVVVGALRGGDETPSSGAGVAQQAAAQPSPSATPTPPPPSAEGEEKKKRRDRPRRDITPEPEPLPSPEGTCADRDVLVSPSVEDAVAGSDVTVSLQLKTAVAVACTWKVSPDSVTLKITSGSDDIWASRQCPAVVPERLVTVRRDSVATVDVMWNARRSDDDCPQQTEWALPGYYVVDAAALGGEPADVQFLLARPVATAEPDKSDRDRKQDGEAKRDRERKQDRNRGQDRDRQRGGAVEPDPR